MYDEYPSLDNYKSISSLPPNVIPTSTIIAKMTTPLIEQHIISADSIMEMAEQKFFTERQAAGKHTTAIVLDIEINTPAHWQEEINYYKEHNFVVTMISSLSGFAKRDNECLIQYNGRHQTHRIYLYGDDTVVTEIAADLRSRLVEVRNTVTWVYSSKGDSIELPLNSKHLPIQEMYPWMDCSLAEYYESFMRDDASILLLIGPPGTGKTTWIKGLLYHANANSIVTYDPEVLAQDSIFADFISGRVNVMVIEDADALLRSRDSGNTLMSRFLNVGSGLISSGKKKLVFSTNLPSLKDVDEALIRPGRCYDILEFRPLTGEEGEVFMQAAHIDSNENATSATIAELYNRRKKSHTIRRSPVGFY